VLKTYFTDNYLTEITLKLCSTSHLPASKYHTNGQMRFIFWTTPRLQSTGHYCFWKSPV